MVAVLPTVFFNFVLTLLHIKVNGQLLPPQVCAVVIVVSL